MMKKILIMSLVLGLSMPVWGMHKDRGFSSAQAAQPAPQNDQDSLRHAICFFISSVYGYCHPRVSQGEKDSVITEAMRMNVSFEEPAQEEQIKRFLYLGCLVKVLEIYVKSQEKPYAGFEDISTFTLAQILKKLGAYDPDVLADWILSRYNVTEKHADMLRSREFKKVVESGFVFAINAAGLLAASGFYQE